MSIFHRDAYECTLHSLVDLEEQRAQQENEKKLIAIQLSYPHDLLHLMPRDPSEEDHKATSAPTSLVAASTFATPIASPAVAKLKTTPSRRLSAPGSLFGKIRSPTASGVHTPVCLA